VTCHQRFEIGFCNQMVHEVGLWETCKVARREARLVGLTGKYGWSEYERGRIAARKHQLKCTSPVPTVPSVFAIRPWLLWHAQVCWMCDNQYEFACFPTEDDSTFERRARAPDVWTNTSRLGVSLLVMYYCSCPQRCERCGMKVVRNIKLIT